VSHSPAPWTWDTVRIGVERLVEPGGGLVLEVREDGGTFHLSPDGRLIARAPELLELVREAGNYIGVTSPDPRRRADWERRRDALLARIEGTEPDPL
jgi:hypothetical protein